MPAGSCRSDGEVCSHTPQREGPGDCVRLVSAQTTLRPRSSGRQRHSYLPTKKCTRGKPPPNREDRRYSAPCHSEEQSCLGGDVSRLPPRCRTCVDHFLGGIRSRESAAHWHQETRSRRIV